MDLEKSLQEAKESYERGVARIKKALKLYKVSYRRDVARIKKALKLYRELESARPQLPSEWSIFYSGMRRGFVIFRWGGADETEYRRVCLALEETLKIKLKTSIICYAGELYEVEGTGEKDGITITVLLYKPKGCKPKHVEGPTSS